MAKSQRKATPENPIRHEMPLAHFWVAFSQTMNARNQKLAEFVTSRMEDDLACATKMVSCANPAEAMSTLVENRQRALAETTALAASMMLMPLEVGGEVADLAKEEAQVMKKKGESVFDEVPV